jgi:hypothetical protein
LLPLACLIALGAALQDFRFSKSFTQAQSQFAAIDHEVSSLSVAMSDLRGAQMAYLAAGQEPDFWMRRVTELFSQVDAGLGRLRESVDSSAARTHVEAAASAVADLMNNDKRARTALESDQRFVASEVIFTDSVASSQIVASELAAVRTASTEVSIASMNWQSTGRLALAPLALTMVLLSAYFAGRASHSSDAGPATIAEMLRDLPPAVKATGAASKPTVPVPAPAVPVNLNAAAELCVDLARVMDARDMQSLLERTAKVLEASGMILWVVNQERTSLLPLLTHGYSERVLGRLTALDVAADNVTSYAYRSVRPQTMLGAGPGTTSAIAVPLVTAGGCNGVLAAEVSDAKPSAEFISLSRLIAAQFSTMISPCETSSAKAAAEA